MFGDSLYSRGSRQWDEENHGDLSRDQYEIPPDLDGRDAVHHCLVTGVKFTGISSPHRRKIDRIRAKYDSWYQCPMCFQPFVSSGVPDVMCLSCWYDGTSEKPIIFLGRRKRLLGRLSREVR